MESLDQKLCLLRKEVAAANDIELAKVVWGELMLSTEMPEEYFIHLQTIRPRLERQIEQLEIKKIILGMEKRLGGKLDALATQINKVEEKVKKLGRKI